MTTQEYSKPAVQLPLFPTEKRCARCGMVKPREQFHCNRSRPDGLHGSCIECRRGEATRVVHRLPPLDTLKQCRGCKQTLPLSCFPPRQGGRDGRQSQCRACFSVAHHAWYLRAGNRERVRARRDAWNAAHEKRLKEYKAEWYVQNRARIRELARLRAGSEAAPEAKVCAQCKELKPIANFGSNRSRPDSHDIYCKRCAAARSRTWSMAHWKECYARHKRWVERKRVSVRARRRAYRAGHPLLVRGQERLYDARHSAQLRQREAAYKAAWTQRNRQRLNVKRREHYARDPSYDLLRKKLRRARQSAAGGAWTLADEELLYEVQGGRCAYCGTDIAGRYCVDHMRAVSRGGCSDLHNLVLACRSCNSRKWAQSAGVFLARLLRQRRAERRALGRHVAEQVAAGTVDDGEGINGLNDR